MTGRIRIAAAIFCILCVVAICIAPLVDLPATRLRPDSLAILLLGWIVTAAGVSLLFPHFFVAVRIPATEYRSRPLRHLLELNCTLLR